MLLVLPDSNDSRKGLLASFLLFFINIIFILISINSTQHYYFVSILLFIFNGYLFVKYNKNILYSFRYALLLIIPFATAIARSNDLYIAPFGASYQTDEASFALIACGLLASSGASISWFLVSNSFNIPRNYFTQSNYTFPKLNANLSEYLILFFIVLVVFLLIYRNGGLNFNENLYSDLSSKVNFNFGAFNAFFWVFVSYILFLHRFETFNNKITLIFFSLVIILLTGTRADYLMQFFLLIFVFFIKYRPIVFEIRNYSILFLSMLIFIAYISSSYIGYWRDGNESEFDLFNINYLVNEREAGEVLSISTGNQMAGTFYAVYGKLNYSEIKHDLLYGESYLDYFERLIPGFLHPDRPLSKAYEMFIDGTQMAQGGIYELAESYWNFWYLGAFIIPFLWGCFFAYLLGSYYKHDQKYSSLPILFMAMLFMSPRAVWYQNFVYFRVISVFILIEIVLIFVSFLLSRRFYK